MQLSRDQLEFQRLGNDKRSVIGLQRANVQLLTKSGGVEYMRIALRKGDVIEICRTDTTQAVSLILTSKLDS
jgi:hypothetical protein